MKQKQKGFSVVELLVVLVILAAIGGVGYVVFKRSQTSPKSDSPAAVTENKGQKLEFEEGIRLQPSDFGVAVGQPVADVSAYQLDNGTWRIYAFAQNKGIVSATSDNGLDFTPEAGERLPDGSGMPRAVKLDDGTIRLYFIDGGGVKSALSTDGLDFTKEDGFRITPPDGVGAITGISTPVKLNDGMWHVYFSELPRPGEGIKSFTVYSAISSDLVNWAVEDGIRLGDGTLVSSAEHPDAVVNSKGEVVLYFFVNQSRQLMTATSADGVTFGNAQETGLDCNDPDVVPIDNGRHRIYCGDFDEQIGGIVKSAIIPELPQ